MIRSSKKARFENDTPNQSLGNPNFYLGFTPLYYSNIDEATQSNGPSTSCTVSDMDSKSDLPLSNLADIKVITSRVPWIKLESIPSSIYKKLAAFIRHKCSDSKQFLSLSQAMKEDIVKLLSVGTSLTRKEKSVSKELVFKIQKW